jgi:hypothetical protein
MLGCVYPVTVQRGKTSTVTVYASGNGGSNVYGAYKALIEGGGMHAEVVPPEKGWPARDPKAPDTVPGVDHVDLRVTVDADAAPGVRELRLGTPHHGVSSVALIVISDEPQVTEMEPNNDAAHAQTVSVPCVVNGRLQQSEDMDYYRFHATAGMELTFSMMCARLEDKIHDLQDHADPMMVLYDATDNKELASSDDYYGTDPLMHFRFEKAGDYLLMVRDVRYGGNPNWVYSLDITNRPYVTATSPCAVTPGQSVDLKLAGWNLGAGTAHLQVPADARPGVWRTPLTLASGVTNPVPLLITSAPQTTTPPHAAQEHGLTTASLKSPGPVDAGRLALPGGVNGVIQAPGEVDRYAFTAKKGASWSFEVMGRRLDSQIDSEIKVVDAKGSVLAENDDDVSKDSRIDSWAAPADGNYYLEVRDLAGHSGPTYFYNLTATRVFPDFRVRCDTDRAMIAPGNRTTWYAIVDRMHGFAGPVKIDVSGLPAGVTASALTLPPGVSQGPIFLSAADGAKIDCAAVTITGTATLVGPDTKPVETMHTAQPQTEIYMPGGGRGLLGVDTEAVGVTEPNDLQVTADTQAVTLKQGGSVKINVTIKRRADYKKPVTLDVLIQHLGGVFVNPLPPGVSIDDGASKTLLNENETSGYITLKAAPDAMLIKDWPLAVLGNASINFVMKVWYAAAPIALTVAPK